MSIYGDDFKKEFSPILKEMHVDKFASKFQALKEKYANMTKDQTIKASIEGYLDDLYSIKEKWAFCFINKTFSAGNTKYDRICLLIFI